jgi:hypothetical protein
MYAFQSPSLPSPVQNTSSNFFSYPSRRFKTQSEKIALFLLFSKHFWLADLGKRVTRIKLSKSLRKIAVEHSL